MDPLVLGKEIKTRKYGQKSSKRASCYNQSQDYQVKSNDIKGSSRKSTNDSQKAYYNEYYDPRSSNYSSWSVFDGNRSNKKSNYEQGYGKYNDQYELSNYAKGMKSSYNKAAYSDNHSRSTNASSNSDSEISELNGFKIMMNGTVLHDETTDDYESGFSTEPVFQSFPTMEKFASSLMTIGPKENETSLPSFL